ncbi:hypothetical protein [Tateyamaria omphalii]|uniref:Uncharacterized protein n=1 Tax=Tateyamaria omphalii TaxID=299262 RepID=A0A1P8MTF3_9RHOB|nr:hypothetical protein [Tateyamaria omphalii]APX11239.1 hypothetical protein BWR18_05725 [Tateyamaria omphalii]
MIPSPIAQNAILDGYVQQLLQELDAMPQTDRSSAALAITASLLEYAAYEMAQSDEARQVARLILLAADMESTARDLRGTPKSSEPH